MERWVPLTAPAGPVAVFGEADYCFGSGPITLRVERIEWSSPVWYDGENWYPVEGVEIDSDGREFGHRQVSVRGRRLPAPPGSRP